MTHTTTDSATNEQATGRVSLLTRIYGLLCLLDGIVNAVSTVVLVGWIVLAIIGDPASAPVVLGGNAVLSFVVMFVAAGLTLAGAVGLIYFGRSLVHSRRRNAARWAKGLIILTVADVLVRLMLSGVGIPVIRPLAQLVILIAISVTIDPTLQEERKRTTPEERAAREEAKCGMLGRDRTGKGFIELNFFNLFWVFVVCCVLGLVIEVLFHMIVIDPGVYQDRAGLLFGPFSPIYGFGAVLMTVFLNRLWDKNPALIFLGGAVIGGAFEVATSLYMQTAFGVTSWDYTGAMILGLVPDPVAAFFDGRTSASFMFAWGMLGLVWIKVMLPLLLRLINLIPWRLRYGLTSVCAILMLVNGLMTLQSLDCWYKRVSGMEPSGPVEQFYAEYYDDDYMQNRFQTMTITPEDTVRTDAATI